ncbi:MAG: magnetosome protein MamI [Rhodospirillaceae bacterium]
MMPSIMFGLLAVALGLWGLSAWWWSVVELLRGFLPLVLVFVGVLALAAGVTGLRNDGKLKDDESLSNEE